MEEKTIAYRDLQPYKIWAVHPSTGEYMEAVMHPEHFSGKDGIRFPSDGISPPYHLADELEWEDK